MKEYQEWREYYAIKGLEVSEKGYVRRWYDDIRTINGKSEFPHKLKPKADKEGTLYIRIKEGKKAVDVIVCTCFWGKPKGDKNCVIHKDGNLSNNHKDNLKWATIKEREDYYSDPSKFVAFVPKHNDYRYVTDGLYVSKDAKVKQNGKILNVYDSSFDPDMDIEAAIDPHVVVYHGIFPNRSNTLEKLVTAAYLPKPSGLKSPAILHIDNDYKNCSLDNLKWVEDNSDEYQAYLKQRTADIEKRTQELNPYPIKHLMIG